MSAVDVSRSELVRSLRAHADADAAILDVAADELADRLVRWDGAGDTPPLVARVETLCRNFSNVAPLRDLLLAVAALVADAELGRAVTDAVVRGWRPLDFDTARFDEIDARIDELIQTLEETDPLTAEHSRAVASWCGRIARRLGLAESEVVVARRAGLLHDIGKIRVPAAILTAARALEPAEWALMQAHTVEGEQLIRDDVRLRDFATPVRHHHERIDGRGYPDGLRAATLPTVTRIVSVADAFNAMIGSRPYRRPLRPIVAIEELERVRGAQFDAEVVDALIAVIGV